MLPKYLIRHYLGEAVWPLFPNQAVCFNGIAVNLKHCTICSNPVFELVSFLQIEGLEASERKTLFKTIVTRVKEFFKDAQASSCLRHHYIEVRVVRDCTIYRYLLVQPVFFPFVRGSVLSMTCRMLGRTFCGVQNGQCCSTHPLAFVSGELAKAAKTGSTWQLEHFPWT